MSARPPGVTSGLPKTTPIFSRSWLMKMTVARDFEMTAVSLRSACDISRACRPGSESPISPSISARGTSAATLVDDDDVDGVAADERVADLERLLAGVRLRDQQLGDVDAAGLGVVLVERVLDVDVGGDAAGLLRRGDDVVGERRLAGALRAVDLGDAAARQAADAERQVERERAGGDDFDLEVLARRRAS